VILIDSNVLIDVFSDNQAWQSWSEQTIEDAALTDDLAVSVLSIAEVAPRLGSLEKFFENVAILGAELHELSHEAAFTAGTVFNRYRIQRRAAPTAPPSVLPDFLIGGQASMIGATILTRDARFYRRYFPDVPLITPEKDAA
jgi:predicted nucleic acid-binding protein